MYKILLLHIVIKLFVISSAPFFTLGVKAYLLQIDVAQFQSLILEINFYNFSHNRSLLYIETNI